MRPYAELAPPLRPLEDNYELIRELGGTNATIVYLARVRASGRLVALKTIRPQFLRDSEATARFRREARTMSALDHPNIVKTIAVEQVGERTAAIVMEFLEGGSLREILRAQGAMPFDRARAILDDLAEALRYSHGLGIIHRDVKPENIFIAQETGRAMLSDFGIARDMEMDTRLTLAGSAVGTPTYMSPEQIDGQAVDQRSDIYSLGVLGWELVTGLRPWDGETLYGVIYKQKNDDLPAIRTLRADTPASLRLAIEGAMKKAPEERWSSATSFLERLRDQSADASGDRHAGEDLPTLQFRRADETLLGVPLTSLPQSERPTQPVEREVRLRAARESVRSVSREPEVPDLVREPEVRRPRHTEPRRRVEAPTPLQPTVVETRLEPPSEERRETPRVPPAWLVASASPERVQSPRRRSPLVIAIPSAIALAAAALFMARRDHQEATGGTVRDTVVAGASGGSVLANDTNAIRDVAAHLVPSRRGSSQRKARPEVPRKVASTTPGAPNQPRAAVQHTRPRVATRTVTPGTTAPPHPQAPTPMPVPVAPRAEIPSKGETPLLDRVADSDVELNRIYQQLLVALRRASPDSAEPASVTALRTQQRTWLMQRDVACRVGTIDERASCFREQSRSRGIELRGRLESARSIPES